MTRLAQTGLCNDYSLIYVTFRTGTSLPVQPRQLAFSRLSN